MPKRKKATAPRMRRGRVHGSQRALAWVHLVINPLLETLPIEMSFLERGNTTWRHGTHELEFIRSVERYLAPDGRHALRDYVGENSRSKAVFGKHDRLLDEIVAAAEKAHATLLADARFLKEYEQAKALLRTADSSETTVAESVSSYITPELVAERVVNKIKALEHYYVDSRFWEQYETRFNGFFTGPAFDHLDSKRLELLNHDQDFQIWLEKTSFALCKRYDIPAAPLPSPVE